MVDLRPYQVEALEAERVHRAEHPEETRLAIVLATGLGKSIVIAERAVEYLLSFEGAGNRVLVLVHTDEIAAGLEAKLRAHARETGLTVGVVKADRDETDADIVLASVQTLVSPMRRRAVRNVGLVMVDECHHATAPSYRAILEHFGCLQGALNTYPFPPHLAVPVLGLTATLERGDGQSLGSVWQDVAYSRGTSWAVRKGYLVQPIGYRLEIPGPSLTHPGADIPPTLADDWLMNGLAPEVIVREWQAKAAGRPTVAFMPLVRSAHALAAEFVGAGVPAAVVWGGMGSKARAAVMDAYADGSITVLVNAMALTEGWDPPESRRVTCVIIGRPTKSRPLFIQMAGRGLRPDPFRPIEGQDCILLVVADATTDMCTVADLSDRPLDRTAQGALTAMEDQWDLGQDLSDPEHVWLGQVDARQFDPLVTRSSKIWMRTKAGLPFIPIGRQGYVFLVGNRAFTHRLDGRLSHVVEIGDRAPDVELAMAQAEAWAEDHGGDMGRLLADKGRAWRSKVPSEEMLARAAQLGLTAEVDKIMAARAGGKAGKVSDLMTKVIASRALDRFVERIMAE